ncbi:MAG: hypothetical protein M0P91_05335 [Sulfuricurvum sp.]|jgi:hypothetical protein|uniref:hypothetical protein n=1 Tax=Sulfuricurvum sp. TaxID=2025608 RepID=UPI0025FD70A5|nr:hypothetical protein [Sulfuricurvum sp.]MCK9372599.1 hypothetical protein [Sulfuricurvum sp.]
MKLETLQKANETINSLTDIRMVLQSCVEGGLLRIMYGHSENQEIRLTDNTKKRLVNFLIEEVKTLQTDFDSF